MNRKKNKKKNANQFIYLNLVIAALFFALALYSFFIIHKGSTTFSTNLNSELGFLGALLFRSYHFLSGQCMNLFPLFFMIISLGIGFPKLNIKRQTIISFAIIFICLMVFWHLGYDVSSSIQKGTEGFGGGFIGALFAVLLIKSLSKTGAIIALIVILLIALTIASEGAITSYAKLGFQKIKSKVFSSKNDSKHHKRDVDKAKKSSLKINEKILPANEPKQINTGKSKQTIKNNTSDFIVKLKNINEEIIEEDTNEKVENYISSGEQEKSDKSISLKKEEYRLPPSTILDGIESKSITNKKEVEDNAKILLETLQEFGVNGEINNVSIGPTITQYEFKPAAGVRVTKIVNLADDLALSLATTGLRIEAPIPNKSAVGIEVPNSVPRTVKIKEIIQSEEFQSASSNITFALGKDISGHTVIADLFKMPHLLIAGSTGSGKSVCLNALISSILFKAKPNEVKFLMIDPKKVELNHYANIPHLLSPVVTDVKKAAATLKWAVKEMERRYELFAETGARDIKTYNQRYFKNEALGKSVEKDNLEFMPQIIVIIDELADLMMVAPADVEDSICRLAQLARAAGIHLVIATQRPSVDIITGLIKANIPSRIAFAVSSMTDSRTILDMGGAEKLLGNGDMLYFPRGYAKPVRVQGVYVSDDEIDRIVSHVKQQATPIYDKAIEEDVEALVNSDAPDLENSQEAPAYDELLGEACRIFIENGNASISMLQRHFRIGYTRAARIIDELESLGFIGPYEGSKARKVIISYADYQKYFSIEENNE